jgi:hypothetical protein
MPSQEQIESKCGIRLPSDEPEALCHQTCHPCALLLRLFNRRWARPDHRQWLPGPPLMKTTQRRKGRIARPTPNLDAQQNTLEQKPNARYAFVMGSQINRGACGCDATTADRFSEE